MQRLTLAARNDTYVQRIVWCCLVIGTIVVGLGVSSISWSATLAARATLDNALPQPANPSQSLGKLATKCVHCVDATPNVAQQLHHRHTWGEHMHVVPAARSLFVRTLESAAFRSTFAVVQGPLRNSSKLLCSLGLMKTKPKVTIAK